jgi:hypothetical protein
MNYFKQIIYIFHSFKNVDLKYMSRHIRIVNIFMPVFLL